MMIIKKIISIPKENKEYNILDDKSHIPLFKHIIQAVTKVSKFKDIRDVTVLGIGSGSGFLEQALVDFSNQPYNMAKLLKLSLEETFTLKQLKKATIIASNLSYDSGFESIRNSNINKAKVNALNLNNKGLIGSADIVIAKQVLHHIYSHAIKNCDITQAHYSAIEAVFNCIYQFFSEGTKYFIGMDYLIDEGSPLEYIKFKLNSIKARKIFEKYANKYLTINNTTYQRFFNFPYKEKNNFIQLPRLIASDLLSFSCFADTLFAGEEKEEIHVYSSKSDLERECQKRNWDLSATISSEFANIYKEFGSVQKQDLMAFSISREEL